MTLFDRYCNDGMSACIWVIHRAGKPWVELVMLFDRYCNVGMSAGIWVIQRGGKSLGEW